MKFGEMKKRLETQAAQEEVGKNWQEEFRRLEGELAQLLALLEVSDLESARVKIGRLKELAADREPADVSSALRLIREKAVELGLDLDQEESLLSALDAPGQLLQAAESAIGLEDVLRQVKAQVAATDRSARPGLAEVEVSVVFNDVELRAGRTTRGFVTVSRGDDHSVPFRVPGLSGWQCEGVQVNIRASGSMYEPDPGNPFDVMITPTVKSGTLSFRVKATVEGQDYWSLWYEVVVSSTTAPLLSPKLSSIVPSSLTARRVDDIPAQKKQRPTRIG